MTTPDKPILNLRRDVDQFTRAYIEAALWSSTGDDDQPLDARFNWTHLADETIARMVAECAAFQAANDLTGYPTTQAGHDFWLTRNGHGAGFWENDFGTEAQCEALTAACKQAGECWLYVGDDGLIYAS